ncbi:hypothetical protein [Levilactobacillus wangkuiensis]|uniref:hypothetical protein n=1 Tax=Levilactobacillus wangkuiensis TaxID=2799566 RepID=UPI0019407E45|nr:hypothetical protein [Levilactobacillus wangkuiensis]
MKSKLLVSTVAVAAGLAIGGVTVPAVNAQAKTYKATPKKLRGNWHRKIGNQKFKLKITKHTLRERVYNESRRLSTVKLSTKKIINGQRQFYIGKSAMHKGYWNIGLNGSDQSWLLKPVKHHSKKALRYLLPSYGQSTPKVVYYYK